MHNPVLFTPQHHIDWAWYKLCVWWEGEESGGQGPLQLQSKFKASLGHETLSHKRVEEREGGTEREREGGCVCVI